MKNKFISSISLSQYKIWDLARAKNVPFAFDLELTARCNLDCRHCYINLPADNPGVQKTELSFDQIADIVNQSVAMGSLWCLLTGGEPMLRKDFSEIYLMLKRKGLLVSVYSNACLISEEHIALFKKFPPRHIEVTVYGATAETYERVTRRPGSFRAFQRGLHLLLDNGIQVRLKAMAMRSNVAELPAIAEFCRKQTMDFFRFDPLLHLRFDGDPAKNEDIRAERLHADEIVAIEQGDEERFTVMKNNCEQFVFSADEHHDCRHLFRCGTGRNGFTVSPEGHFHLCSSLRHRDCIVDLKKTTLSEAWNSLVPRVRAMTSSDPEFTRKCRACPIVNLCLWCPAHAHLETGRLDGWSEYFCQVAHARAKALLEKSGSKKSQSG
ncbi:MAG: radical SAM protein [Candidatus Aminicenantes bacterium]|nr:radical SAM protein [Candidatus Aminicenantes bacterium]